MAKHFAELSSTAQSAIIDAVLNIPVATLPESVQEEIREWATPPEYIWVVCKGNSWGDARDISEHKSQEEADAVAKECSGCVWVEKREI